MGRVRLRPGWEGNVMNPRRLTAALLAAGTLALGAGTTVASASTPGNSGNSHHRHSCAATTPGPASGKKCAQKPKPTHTPTPTHAPKPHPKHAKPPNPPAP